MCYENGFGVTKDMKQAAKWYRKAAEQGDAGAQYNLGVLYGQGDGVPKDLKQAAEWYRKAAEQGYAEAQFLLGRCYSRGEGVPKDLKQETEWYRKAAEQGFADAQKALGICYAQGEGVPADMKEARKWFRKAAEQRYAEEQFSLGVKYSQGEGVPKDIKRAAELWRKSAEQGYALAQQNLGNLYERGEGVPKDLVQAYMWFNLAAAHVSGISEYSAECRSRIEREMTPDQIGQAQRMSAAFVQKSEINERTEPSEGSFPAPIPDKLSGSGTVFFVTTDGWLVTNAHVARAGSKAKVRLGDKLFPAVVKQVDAANDLALIKVDGQFNALAIERARSAALGVSVFTVGFPNPGLQGYSPKMTKGEISSIAGIKDDPRYFQISAPIQPGNSGGALADESGNVVGVVSAMISDKAAIETTGAIPQNVNYAVKSTYLLAIVESIPDAAKGLRDPVKIQDFAAVQAVEKASAMVLMFE
jgi:TPR repeat protein